MHLRYDDIVEHLRKAVEVRGADYVYPNEWRVGDICQYVYNTQPACIVGQVFHQLGLNLGPLHGFIGSPERGLEALDSSIELDLDAAHLLRVTQGHQDREKPWGESVALAIQETATKVDAEH